MGEEGEAKFGTQGNGLNTTFIETRWGPDTGSRKQWVGIGVEDLLEDVRSGCYRRAKC